MAAFEALLVQGAGEIDARKMTEAYTKAQNILLAEQAVMVPIYYPNRYFRKREWIQGLGVDPFNFLTFRTMRVAQPAPAPTGAP
jgi:peptide/nickel transport system substrate-binding protein